MRSNADSAHEIYERMHQILDIKELIYAFETCIRKKTSTVKF